MRVNKVDERVAIVHAEASTGPLFPTVEPSVRTLAGERFFAEIDNPFVTYDQAAVADRKYKASEAVAGTIEQEAVDEVVVATEQQVAVGEGAGHLAAAGAVAVPDVIGDLQAAQTQLGANAETQKV